MGSATSPSPALITYAVLPALPANLSINATGLISGTPTAATASNTYVVTATQGACSATQTYTFAINTASTCPSGSAPVTLTLVPVVIAPNTLARATINVPYSQQFTGTGITEAYTYVLSLPLGLLPAGLNFNTTTGLLSGTPSFSTSVTFTVVATNANGCSNAPVSYSLVINPNPATSVDNSLANLVKVSPNPSSGDFNVDFGNINMSKSLVRVYDAQGKVVFTSENNANLMIIPLENFANGIYLMEVETSKGRVFKRLAKQ